MSSKTKEVARISEKGIARMKRELAPMDYDCALAYSLRGRIELQQAFLTVLTTRSNSEAYGKAARLIKRVGVMSNG